MINYLIGLDINLFFFINHSLKNMAFDIIMPIITTSEYWRLPILLIFIFLFIFGHKKGKNTFFLCLIGVILSDLVTNQLLKPLFHRLRPFETLENVNLLVNACGYSLPSSHAANMFTSAIVISYIWRKTWIYILMFGLSVLVSFSRIYVGVHYPADVFAGILFSMFFSILTIWLFKNAKSVVPKLLNISKRYIKLGILIILLTSNCLLTADEKKDYVRFIAVGNVMLGHTINNQILKKGSSWPFNNVSDLLQGADILFCNAEFSYITVSSPVARGYISGLSIAAILSLQCAGFDVISLANNHSLECGKKSLATLLDELDKLKIMYTGAGRNYFEAHHPKMIEEKGVKIYFLGYSLFSKDKMEIDKDLPALTTFSEEKMKEDIQIADKSGGITVVSFHWGIEYSSSPTLYQRKLAHLAVDYGADLIVGHNSGYFQGIEKYKDAIILYSLGNFIFDGRDEKNKKGLVFECLISSNIIQQASILPIYINELRPMTLDLDYSYKVAKEIQILSEEFNTLISCKKGIIYIQKKIKD